MCKLRMARINFTNLNGFGQAIYSLALILATCFFSGCGIESRIVDVLDPPARKNKPVAIIRTEILRDHTRGDIYLRMDGTGSYDLEEMPLSYQWELVEKPVRSLSAIVSPTSRITTFDFDWSGCYTVTLLVTNSLGVISDVAITRVGVKDGPRGGWSPAPGDCQP